MQIDIEDLSNAAFVDRLGGLCRYGIRETITSTPSLSSLDAKALAHRERNTLTASSNATTSQLIFTRNRQRLPNQSDGLFFFLRQVVTANRV